MPIASYCSIKRLVLENLYSLKFEPLINLIGIYPLYLKMRIQLELETPLGKVLIVENGYSLLKINNAA
jgi:hypothetical protein